MDYNKFNENLDENKNDDFFSTEYYTPVIKDETSEGILDEVIEQKEEPIEFDSISDKQGPMELNSYEEKQIGSMSDREEQIESNLYEEPIESVSEKEEQVTAAPEITDESWNRWNSSMPVQPTVTDRPTVPYEQPYDSYQSQPQYNNQNYYQAPGSHAQPTEYRVTGYPITASNEPVKQKSKKQGKRFGFGTLIASIVLVGVVSSTCTSVLTASLVNKNTADSAASVSQTSDGKSASIINVTDTTNSSVVEAVAEVVSPSVVGIRVTSTVNNYYFGNSSSSSEGSGVVYTEDGYIITNYHVISSAVETASYNQFGGRFGENQQSTPATVEVFLDNDNTTGYTAQVVGYDSSFDLAVLKIDKKGLTPISIGDSTKLSVGEIAIALGNPGGLEFMGSVSMGIISGLDRSIQTEAGVETNLIQTDAAINPGNSGGALVNKEGQLVGINNSKMSGDGYEGMGFAIPVNTVVEVCDRLIKNENVPTPYVGIYENTYYNADTLEAMGYPAGIVVAGVAANSPASEAGIEQNDIITAVNGVSIRNISQFNSEKNKYSIGETITITVYRGGQTGDLTLTLGQSN